MFGKFPTIHFKLYSFQITFKGICKYFCTTGEKSTKPIEQRDVTAAWKRNLEQISTSRGRSDLLV